MIRACEDRWFDSFRRTGKTRLLAKVFDRTAPELWRVAAHLCRDRHAAEDVVQGTFLTAIEAKDDWDSSRPLLPWLIGMLANRVREHRRRTRPVPDAERMIVTGVSDPSEFAEHREFGSAFREALLRIDEPYRSVLECNLVHGLASHEIASELGVPAGTVRMRLHRGIEQLRHKLPKGFVSGGAVALVMSADAFAAMRQVVLAKVTGATAVAIVGSGHVVSGVIGTVLMKKVIVAAVVLGLVAFATWSFVGHTGSVVDGESSRPAMVVDTTTRPLKSTESAATGRRDASDSLPAANRTAIAIDVLRTATVTGRCVDASGHALLGVGVAIYGHLESGERGKLWMSEHDTAPVWANPERLKTGADGRFSISFVPPPPFTFTLSLSSTGLVLTYLDWDAIDPGAILDVGDVKLDPGITLRGRVTDSRGAAMVKTGVSINHQGDDTAAEDATAVAGERSMRIRKVRVASLRSAADGTFAANTALPEGSYTIYVFGEELVSPPTITLSLSKRDHALKVVVKSLADIPHVSGRVLDDRGEPVANVEVGTRRTDQIEELNARTRRDGTFLLRAKTTPKAATIVLVVRAEEYEYNAQPVEVAWGTQDLTLRVVRGGELTVRVTDPEQRAIERFTVRMVPREHGQSSDDGRVRSEGHHEDGIAVVHGLLRGKWLIVVDFPDRPGSDVLVTPLQIDTIRATRVDLVLQPSVERIVRVVRGDGSPVAGTSVCACDLCGNRWHDNRVVMDYENWLRNASAPHGVLRVASATTDKHGRAVIRGPGGRAFLLQVESQQHLTKNVDAVRLDTLGELRVVVQAGAELHGRIEPPAALDELRRLANLKPGASFGSRAPFLTLVAVEGHARFPLPGAWQTGNQPLAIADDGTFASGGLPPGAWNIFVQSWQGNSQGRASVGSVALVEGQASERIVKIPWLLPGTLEGTVFWNGEPFATQNVTLVSVDSRYLQATTDNAGKFTLLAAKGRYSLRLSVSSEQRAIDLTAPEAVDVTSGEVAQCEFRVTSGRVRLRVLDPDGAPLSRMSLMAARPGEDFRYQPVTGVDGKVELQLPPGTWTFAILPKRLEGNEERTRLWREGNAAGLDDPLAEYRLALRELVVQAGADERLEVRLPPEWLR